MPGETGPVLHEITRPIAAALGGLFAIAAYNTLELYILIFRTFHRRRGLYFWSAMCTNTAIPSLSLFSLLRYFDVVDAGPAAILIDLSWWTMVTGQALVLYSRLHLVIGDPKKLRWLLWMIVGAFVLLELPTAILFAYISFNSKNNRVTTAFDVMEITQLVIFTVQECILSGLYVYESRRTLKPMEAIKGPIIKKMCRELVALFILVFLLDVSLVVVQTTGFFFIQTTYKPLVYSIKLKMETFILNNLVNLLSHPSCSCLQSSFQSDRWALPATTDAPGRGLSWPWRAASAAGRGADEPLPTPLTSENNAIRTPMRVSSFVNSSTETSNPGS